ncbi:hypothetical protein PSYJA_00290 [Pseudomonas syringae pv. japonica str. M301072]|uniref:Uncharacterized protein n=1 Tax=Pseudomonas syringae pv. japonica str. M301072 TaxID=629262 RepID=F3FBG0_PSESX|nr:hypothetical protein PSYJA_00290 [Pseudomonas syringae pv. japonica str. M301072]
MTKPWLVRVGAFLWGGDQENATSKVIIKSVVIPETKAWM